MIVLTAHGVEIEAPANAHVSPKGIVTWTYFANCHRCGGVRGSKHWPGFTCYECGGHNSRHQPYERKAYTPEAYARISAAAERKRIKRITARDTRLIAATGLTYDQLAQTLNFVFDIREDRPDPSGHLFAMDVISKASKFDLSEKQAEAINRAVDKARDMYIGDELAREEAKAAAERKLIDGRHALTGKFISRKFVDNEFGGAYKGVFVAAVDGGEARIYCTVPGSVEVGAEIALKVTTKHHEKGFHYGSRPALAK